MSSRFRKYERVPRSGAALVVATIGAAIVVVGAGCRREERRFSEQPSLPATPPPVRQSELQPGPTTAGPGPTSGKSVYDGNAYAVAEGKRLFTQMNCVGCHAHGGGGIGPPLMDDQWIYGSAAQNIYQTIMEGRPNGMPSFGGKLPSQQVWQLVAYVRSMSGLLPKDVASGRDDEMQVRSQEQATKKARPTQSFTPPSAER